MTRTTTTTARTSDTHPTRDTARPDLDYHELSATHRTEEVGREGGFSPSWEKSRDGFANLMASGGPTRGIDVVIWDQNTIVAVITHGFEPGDNAPDHAVRAGWNHRGHAGAERPRRGQVTGHPHGWRGPARPVSC